MSDAIVCFSGRNMQKLTLLGSKTGALPYKRVRPRFILSVDEPFRP